MQLGMDLQPKLSLRRQLMGLRPKYNDLILGRAWLGTVQLEGFFTNTLTPGW